MSSASDSSSSSSSSSDDSKEECADAVPGSPKVLNMETDQNRKNSENSMNIDLFEGTHHRNGSELAEANLAATQSADSSFPLGPSTYADLFFCGLITLQMNCSTNVQMPNHIAISFRR